MSDDLKEMNTFSVQLWNDAFADQINKTNALLDLMKEHGLVDGGPRKRKHRKTEYRFLKEREILKRLNRCKTPRGKLWALSRILDEVRRDSDDYDY